MMIKIYKNENDELECHVNYAGYDFKFQCIKNGFGATFKGSNSTEYREFESYIDEDGEILDNLQDVMYHIASVCNWRESFGEERDDLKRKLDDVVDLFNTHLYHKKAWSDNPYYDRVQQRLNKILEGYPLKATRLRRLYSTEIEQALKNKDLSECLFLLEKIKMDLEEDE